MCFHRTFFVFCSQAGFFKSKYKDMIKDAGGEADPAANEDATAPEQQE